MVAFEVAPELSVPPSGLISAPRSVDIAITGKCNLRCKYCFYADEMTALNDLPTENWLAFFDELGELAVQRVTLTGGEVFTRPDLFQLVDGIIANRMRYSILTNGTLITERLLDKFETGKRRLRMDSVQVSIDGSRSEIHNLSRPNSFDRAMRGLRLLVERDFPVTVRVTINTHNVNDLDNIARLLLEDIGLPGFSTNEAFPMGSGKCSGESVLLTRSQRSKAMETLVRLNESYGGRISASAGPLALSRIFTDIEFAIANGIDQLPGCGMLSSCGGVFSKLDIQHDGTIVACHLLPTLSMGTIGEVDIKEVWSHHPNINIVRQRRSIPLQSLETCHDCRFVNFCTGGCPGIVMAQTGELNARDPMSCYRLHLAEESSDAM